MARTTATGDAKKRKIAALADAIARQDDCDVLLFNYGLEPGLEYGFFNYLQQRQSKRPNLLLLLTTEGGDANTAYRLARRLQRDYKTVTILVAGWCKSAGTLLCIAAHHLIISDAGELGPLDVQIAKADEVGERSSGLVVEAAFEKLQEESFQLFISHLMDLKDQAGRITFKTAAEIAAQMMIGQTREIFAKIEPLTVGEDYRLNLIAEQYAIRLNLVACNLVLSRSRDGLRMLLRGYPSHGFVIDREEASRLFKSVSRPAGKVAELTELLGTDVLVPRNSMREQMPKLEYLNAERTQAAKTKGATSRKQRGATRKAVPRDKDVR